MKIKILTIGKIKQRFFEEAESFYQKKIAYMAEIEIIDKKLKNEPKDIEARKNKEAELILSSITSGEILVCLDEHGQEKDSQKLAKFLKQAEENGQKLVFCIGGIFGLADKVLAKADQIISLSKSTFTQDLAKIVLLENIYRSLMINNNLPFHK